MVKTCGIHHASWPRRSRFSHRNLGPNNLVSNGWNLHEVQHTWSLPCPMALHHPAAISPAAKLDVSTTRWYGSRAKLTIRPGLVYPLTVTSGESPKLWWSSLADHRARFCCLEGRNDRTEEEEKQKKKKKRKKRRETYTSPSDLERNTRAQ